MEASPITWISGARHSGDHPVLRRGNSRPRVTCACPPVAHAVGTVYEILTPVFSSRSADAILLPTIALGVYRDRRDLRSELLPVRQG